MLREVVILKALLVMVAGVKLPLLSCLGHDHPVKRSLCLLRAVEDQFELVCSRGQLARIVPTLLIQVRGSLLAERTYLGPVNVNCNIPILVACSIQDTERLACERESDRGILACSAREALIVS